MDYKIHDNGWTVIVENFDLKSATTDTIKKISELISRHTLIVFKKQSLSIADELKFVKMFSNPVALYQPEDDDYDHVPVPGTEGYILRVGGEVNLYGVPGIAEHESEMAWHHDFHWQLENKPSLIMLYGLKGVVDSKTSWINNLASYQELSEDIKNLLEPLHGVMLKGTDFNVDKFYTDPDGTRWPHGQIVDGYAPKMIRNSRLGVKGLYFPFHQIYNFVGMDRESSKKILLEVSKIITQEKYRYDHIWDTGDLIISDQWFGLHMRWPCQHISNRLLHRAMFDYPES